MLRSPLPRSLCATLAALVLTACGGEGLGGGGSGGSSGAGNTPTAVITAPADGTTLNASDTLTISGTANNAASLSIRIDTGPQEALAGTTLFAHVLEPGALTAGSHSATVTAAGASGQTASDTVNFTLQTMNAGRGGRNASRGAMNASNGATPITYASSVDGQTLGASLYLGSGYAANNKVPLVVMLHGGGGNGTFNPGLTAELDRRGWIGIAPDGRLWNLFNQGCRWQWSAANVDNPDPDVGPGERDILDAIDWARSHYAIDPDRIYLTGFSMGGRGTYHLGMRNPDLFAAVAPQSPASDMYEVFQRRPEPAACKEGMTGGKPGDSPMVDTFYSITSGRFLVENAYNLPVFHVHGTSDTVAVNVPGSGGYLHGYHMLTDGSWNGAHGGVANLGFGHTPTLTELRAAFPSGYDWAYMFTNVQHQVDTKWFANQAVGTSGIVEGTRDPNNSSQYLGMFQFFERRSRSASPATIVYKTYTDTHRRAYWAEIEIRNPWTDVPGAIVATRDQAANRLNVELARVNRASFDLPAALLTLSASKPLTVMIAPLDRSVFDPALRAVGETLTPRIALKGSFSSLATVSATLGGAPLDPSLITRSADEIVIGPLPQINASTTLVIGAGS